MYTCKECNQENTENTGYTDTGYEWCRSCNAKHFQQNFKNWTSGNDEIDKFIQHTQITAICHEQALEWIPYDRFYDFKYIAEGGFGKVYRAKWKDGYIQSWDIDKKNWERYKNEIVALKILNNSKNITLEFMNEITSHHKIIDHIPIHTVKLYGITQDPETKNYIIVMEYAENGSLRNYLDNKYSDLSWKDKIGSLWCIAIGLDKIHEENLIHRDLHIGNILMKYDACITDMGLCRPADHNLSENTKKNIYGVLPYVAPEILREKNYTKSADIYSFGIIMCEIISGLPPYHDISHDENLALKICLGLRPRFNEIKVPQFIVYLIKRCLDANPLNRPTADELEVIFHVLDDKYEEKTKELTEPTTFELDEILLKWNDEFIKEVEKELMKLYEDKKLMELSKDEELMELSEDEELMELSEDEEFEPKILSGWDEFKRKTEESAEIKRQISKVDENSNNMPINSKPSTSLSYVIHPEAIYMSRLLNFNNLSEPKNSNDYYEHDDIISTKFSDGLLFDFSKLKIKDDQ